MAKAKKPNPFEKMGKMGKEKMPKEEKMSKGKSPKIKLKKKK